MKHCVIWLCPLTVLNTGSCSTDLSAARSLYSMYQRAHHLIILQYIFEGGDFTTGPNNTPTQLVMLSEIMFCPLLKYMSCITDGPDSSEPKLLKVSWQYICTREL